METPNNKQSYFPMPDDISLEFIKYMMKPGNPNLGLNLGWFQPNDEQYIKFGDTYTIPSFNEYQMTLHDLLDDTVLGFQSAKSIVNQFKAKFGKGYQYKKIELNGIWETEVFRQFIELENEQKCLFRLSILALNTMTELHNFACSYMEYLAGEYAKDSDDWQLYESDNYNSIDSIVSEYIGELKGKINFTGYLQYNNTDEYYHYLNQWEISEYISQLDKNTLDLIEDIFGYDVRWDRNDILKVLSITVDWIKNEWITGNLSFQLSDDMPDKIKQFVVSFNSQTLLPGFESL